MMRYLTCLLLLCGGLLLAPALGDDEASVMDEGGGSDEEFTFDFSEPETKPYSVGGYLELRPTLSLLGPAGALYDLGFADDGRPRTQTQSLLRAQVEGTYDWASVHLKLRTNSDLLVGPQACDQTTTIHEAYASWQVDPYLTIDVGKKQVKWGTGYSWSPVAFLDRPKDPDEPEQSRAGYTLVSADYVKAFPGRLQNLGLTLAVVPRSGDMNSGFGEGEATHCAGRLHLLWDDTDIDLMALSGGSQPARYGLDFARNLQTNFEIHGEWSFTPSEHRTVVARDGSFRTEIGPVHRALLGLRYLTPSDVTYILEYQHNGSGYSRGELGDFYDYVDDAVAQFQATGDAAALAQARRLNRLYYSSRPLGRNALYLRASIKEPNNILYFTPAVTLQLGLDDGSFSLAPEVLYTGFENWELRARLFLLSGDAHSEFGGRQADGRLELMVRRYF